METTLLTSGDSSEACIPSPRTTPTPRSGSAITGGSNLFGDALIAHREARCRPGYGLMFWFNRNRFVGSYLRLIWTRRS